MYALQRLALSLQTSFVLPLPIFRVMGSFCSAKANEAQHSSVRVRELNIVRADFQSLCSCARAILPAYVLYVCVCVGGYRCMMRDVWVCRLMRVSHLEGSGWTNCISSVNVALIPGGR